MRILSRPPEVQRRQPKQDKFQGLSSSGSDKYASEQRRQNDATAVSRQPVKDAGRAFKIVDESPFGVVVNS